MYIVYVVYIYIFSLYVCTVPNVIYTSIQLYIYTSIHQGDLPILYIYISLSLFKPLPPYISIYLSIYITIHLSMYIYLYII